MKYRNHVSTKEYKTLYTRTISPYRNDQCLLNNSQLIFCTRDVNSDRVNCQLFETASQLTVSFYINNNITIFFSAIESTCRKHAFKLSFSLFFSFNRYFNGI